MQALELDKELETPTEINFSPLLRRYTLEEFWALPEPEDRAHYDLIGGYLFMVPAPNPPHGDLASRRRLPGRLGRRGVGRPASCRDVGWRPSSRS